MANEIIDFYKKVLEGKNTENKKDSIEEEEIIEKVEESIDESIILPETSEEPFDNFLLKLSEKIEENSNKIIVEEPLIIENEPIIETPALNPVENENPFNNFLKSFVETVENDKLKKEETIKEDTINFIKNLKNEPKISSKIKRKIEKKNKPKLKLVERKIEKVQYIKEENDVKDEPIVDEPKVSDNNDYVKELENTDKSENKIANKVDKHSNIKNIIAEQVKEEVAKIKTQISRMAIEGGGGSVAVQYANGGTMNGDLNVTGRYLSAGVDLSTLIGSGGSGGGYGDRLISGSKSLILNPDGNIDFPNNTISPKDESIITIQSSNSALDTFTRLSLTPHGLFAYDENSNSITIDSIENDIVITSQDTYEWKFNSEGFIEGPNGSLNVLGDLSATGRIFQNGNDLQSEIESLSSILYSTKTTVQSNSAEWESAYFDTVVLNQQVSNIQSNIITLDGSLTNVTNVTNSINTLVNSNSANWNSSYTTVNTNSANWNYQGSDIKALTGFWDTTYNTVENNSSNWNSAYNKVNNLVIADISNLQSSLTGKQDKGNYPVLDNDNKIPAIYLPSYVDDILEYNTYSLFPIIGNVGKIYVSLDNGKAYRWGGTIYTEIVSSPGTTDSLAEGSVNKYFTNARAASAAPVQSVAGRTGNIVLGINDITNLNTQLTATNVTTSTFQVKAVSQGAYNDGVTIPAGTSLETIIRNMLITRVFPTYNAPLLSVAYGSPAISTTYEVGFTIPTFTINPTYTQRDGGSLVGYAYFRNSSLLGNGSTFTVNSFPITSTTTLQVSARYNDGPIYNDNLGDPYPNTSIKAGSITNTITINTLYPYFYGKSSTQPTAASIAAEIQAGTATKVLADANGTVSIGYNANGEFIWFAHIGTQTTKTKWYFTELNSGNIGNGNFINAPVTQNVTSPQGYWANTQYKIYISSGQTSTTGALQFRNS